MKVLVTGGAGFIGSCLVDRLLAEGHAVDVVDDLSSGSLANLADARSGVGHQVAIHQLDVGSGDLPALFARRRPEVVYHLAARTDPATLDDPVADADRNVVGSLRVLEAARGGGVSKVVFATSGAAIYGEAGTRDLPVKESHPQRPVTAFGVGRKAVGDYLALYRDRYGLEFSALALGTVYGPRQTGRGPVASVAARLAAGERPIVHGDGKQTRDFVFVDDAVDALARAATRGSGLLLNVGTGAETSINELVGLLAGIAGAGREVERRPAREGLLRRVALDPARASLHLGWEPWTPLADGLAATWRWWLERSGPPG